MKSKGEEKQEDGVEKWSRYTESEKDGRGRSNGNEWSRGKRKWR